MAWYNSLRDLTGDIAGGAHAVGGVLDNKWTKAGLAAALAATGVGTPAAMALMAGEGALGGALHPGGGLRDAFTGGVSGAGYGAAASQLGGAVRGAFAPSSAGASYGAGSSVPGAGIGAASSGPAMEAFTAPPMGATATAASRGGSGALDAIKGAFSGAGEFVKNNPTAVSMGLQGAGNIATSGAQNRVANAQAHNLETQGQQSEYDLQRQRARDAALEPIRQALMGQLSQLRTNQYGIPANPYAPRG